MSEDNPNIRVEITDPSEFHCFKLMLNPRFEACENCGGHGELFEPSMVHEEPPRYPTCDVCRGEGKVVAAGTGLEIMLHARSLVDLIHKCSFALCEWQAYRAAYLIERLTGQKP
jgi:hypothetical protein